jgi:Replication-relaxation
MSQQTYRIGEPGYAVLRALSRYHYLTAAQVSRLLYPNLSDQNREAQRLLKGLTDADYVLRLRALPTPRYGQAPHVFTLARNGRQYLQGLGVSVQSYFRPSEEAKATENRPFMIHRLATIDVMIAAEGLCRDGSVTCPAMLSERELKQNALKVDVLPSAQSTNQGTRRVAVIPDAWFQLSVGGRPPISIAVELDRATEDQKVWRQKVAAYTVWADGPYRQSFETDNLTIAVVCPDETRRALLIDWTMRELTVRALTAFADLFLFTATSPTSVSPQQFFFGKVWQQPHTGRLISALDPLPPSSEERGIVYQTI